MLFLHPRPVPCQGNFVIATINLYSCGRRNGLMVSAQDSSGPGLSPGWYRCAVFLLYRG